jgi:predicted dehydrogenase
MLNIALVGCGFMGRMHANVYQMLPNATVAGVVGRRRDKVKAFAEEFNLSPFKSFEQALADPAVQAVDICLPTFLHADHAVAAAEAGKHVICEKPMALTVAEADRMVAAARANNVVLMIAHCIRFWPEYERLKELIDSGELGRLLSINLTRYGQFPTWGSDNWLGDESKCGGAALDMHVHDTDFALHILGEPTETFSRGSRDERGISQIFTTMTFAEGTIAHLEGGWNLPPGTPFKMMYRAIFERGAAIWDGSPLTIYRDGAEPETPQFEEIQAQGGGNISSLGGYYRELDYFVSCVLSGQQPERCTPESSRASLRIALEEIRQASAAT